MELRDIFSEGGYQLLTSIAPFAQNDISGHSAAYLSGMQGYWELRLDIPTAIPNVSTPNTLVIQLSTHLGQQILDFMNAPSIQFLLNSVEFS